MSILNTPVDLQPAMEVSLDTHSGSVSVGKCKERVKKGRG